MSADRRLHAPRVEAVHPYTPFGDDELDQSIPERFEKQVLIHPDRLAIRSHDGSFTYADLNRTANRLAQRSSQPRALRQVPSPFSSSTAPTRSRRCSRC